MDLSKGNHKVMYEPPNRGRKTHGSLNRGLGINDPGSVSDPRELVNTFLLPRGYTMVWSGWDFSAGNDSKDYNTYDYAARGEELLTGRRSPARPTSTSSVARRHTS
jgi:hypothetical protein